MPVRAAERTCDARASARFAELRNVEAAAGSHRLVRTQRRQANIAVVYSPREAEDAATRHERPRHDVIHKVRCVRAAEVGLRGLAKHVEAKASIVIIEGGTILDPSENLPGILSLHDELHRQGLK